MTEPGGGEANKPHYLGHRSRLAERFRQHGAESLSDYELLELLLFQVLPRRDTKPIAKALLAKFRSFSGVLSAPPERLTEVDGVGEKAALHLNLLSGTARRFAKDALSDRPLLSSWQAVLEYCRSAMAYEEREQFRILFLDKKNNLIADEVQQTGTVDHTPVYPREVVKRALELSSTAIILAHNHPSGDPTPSQADIEMTGKIVEIATPLGIVVHDHIIVGRDGHSSFKALGLI